MSKIFSTVEEGADIGVGVVGLLQKLRARDDRLLGKFASALRRGESSSLLQSALAPAEHALLARFDGRLADQVNLHDHFEALLAPVGSIAE